MTFLDSLIKSVILVSGITLSAVCAVWLTRWIEHWFSFRTVIIVMPIMAIVLLTLLFYITGK